LGKTVALKPAALLGLTLTLGACSPEGFPVALPFPGDLPAMPWDDRPEATSWTTATMLAVRNRDADLAAQVPGDIALWCPGYAENGMAERRAFWTGLVALTAQKESGFNPRLTGPGGYVGLMQISTGTARNAGCSVTDRAGLTDGENNLFCAVEIMADRVAADGEAVGAKGNRGIGRDWGPWRKKAVRAEAADFLKRQSYCQ
jgi:hypothetical protein